MTQFIPTSQQFRIAASNFQGEGHKILINAFSGTGKTATMKLFAETRPESRILYLVFTRANKEEARSKMPTNVLSDNFHSMALRFMPEFQGRIQRSFLSFQEIGKILARYGVRVDNKATALGMKIFQAWCQSDHTEITEELLAFTIAPPSFERAARNASAYTGSNERAQALYQNKLEQLFRTHGRDGIQVAKAFVKHYSNPDVSVPHDFYLKKFQLEGIQLPFDYIILDEAQDTNDVCKRIVLQQKATAVIVGDSHQSIYNWRGAVDALKQLTNTQQTERYYLTQTFRFGQSLATAATYFLSRYKKETMALEGRPDKTTEIKFYRENLSYQALSQANLQSGKKTTYLFRTNREALAFAISMVQSDLPISFLNGIENYGMNEIEDIDRLIRNKKHEIITPQIKQFENETELAEHIKVTGDRELERYYNLAKTGMKDMRNLKEKSRDEQTTGILITTAHRAKGLEWSQVTLGSDFPDLEDIADKRYCQLANLPEGSTLGECIRACVDAGPDPELDRVQNTRLATRRQGLVEEANIIYVAATRAIDTLIMPHYLKKSFIAPKKTPVPAKTKP